MAAFQSPVGKCATSGSSCSAAGSPCSMADRMRETSLIRSRITPQQEASKNGPRKTVLALLGLLDLRSEAEFASALRPDIPEHFRAMQQSCEGPLPDSLLDLTVRQERCPQGRL